MAKNFDPTMKREKNKGKAPVEGRRTNPVTRQRMNRNERRDASRSLRDIAYDPQSAMKDEWDEE